MSIDDEIELEHLLFFDRKCRVCGKVKSLMDDFYLNKKKKKTLASSYSFECQECTVKRVSKGRKSNLVWEYPDW